MEESHPLANREDMGDPRKGGGGGGLGTRSDDDQPPVAASLHVGLPADNMFFDEEENRNTAVIEETGLVERALPQSSALDVGVMAGTSTGSGGGGDDGGDDSKIYIREDADSTILTRPSALPTSPQDASPAAVGALDIEEGGGNGSCSSSAAGAVGGDGDVTNSDPAAAAAATGNTTSASEIACGDAGDERSSGRRTSFAERPRSNRSIVAEKRRSSHCAVAERNRSSHTSSVVAERRAESKQARAAPSAAAAAASAAVSAAFISANISHHSSSSSLQPENAAAAAASSSPSPSGLGPSEYENASSHRGSLTPIQSGSGLVAAAPREAVVRVGSRRGVSVESQPTVTTAVTASTEARDSVSTNGGSATSGAGFGVGGVPKGEAQTDTGSSAAGGGGGDGGSKDNSDPPDKDGEGAAVDGVAMLDDGSAAASSVHYGAAEAAKAESPSCLQRTCLSPSHSLRNQLYLSYGTVSAVALLFVILAAIITTTLSGNQVKTMSRQHLEAWAKRQLGHSSHKAAATLTRKFSNFDGLASIMMEAASDRFVGYPDHPGYASDANVPFVDEAHVDTDAHTGTEAHHLHHAYPLKSDPLPLDWQLVSNVNKANAKEHLQDRYDWYESGTGADKDVILLSTASAIFRMQGACDPSVTDPGDPRYYPGCTEANNNVTTGGAVQPTETAGLIASKVADLNFVLKPLYEYHTETRGLGYYFANSGAGSVVSFPHLMNDGRRSYTSAGCEWMAAPNPMDPSRPIGTQEMIDTCHPAGERVNGREYNPMERGWCQKQAMNPNKAQNVGPYLDAFKDGLWLITIGRAVYDRLTGEFIACTLADVSVEQIGEIMEDISFGETTEVALLRWDDEGTVVASPRWDSTSASSTISVLDADLSLGLDEATFEQFKSLVDFTKPWDPIEVRRSFEENLLRTQGKMLSAFPIPVPPAEYDPEYFPEFLVVSSIDVDEVFDAVNKMDAAVSESVAELIRATLIAGLVGMAVIIVVIYIVGLYLTRPLQGMNRIGDQIVDTFGDHDQAIDYSQAETLWCSPRTEISDLAQEFRTMVKNFSGTGSAKIVKQKFTEVINPFTLFDEFRDLYDSRRDEYFPYEYKDSTDTSAGITSLIEYERAQAEGGSSLQGPKRRHFGPNIKTQDTIPADATSQMSIKRKHRVMSSPLFRWVVASIMTPLLVTMIIISALVTYEISQLFPTLVLDVQEAFVGLETQALATTASLRASFAGEVMDQAIRDLHLLTRVASWLLFGALQSSKFFPAMLSGAEQCKGYPNDGSCPLMTDRYSAPCDCNWRDQWGTKCYDYDDNVDTRQLQRVFFEGLSQDVWPNGDRNSTTYPLVASTAKSTEWWDDVDEVPGAEKGDLSQGYGTTYDRLRMLSTLSVIQIPLYNYGSTASSGRPLATYIGFESDGMFSGYVGCKHTHAQYAHWTSSESNGAAKLRPEICPVGKHGYDPRCRGWYDVGRKIGMEGGNPLHVTTPYAFASGTTAQSSTLPLIDPHTGEHIGQALLDFLPEDIVASLRPENTPLAEGGFPLLITAQPDSFGADTVVGPGYTIEGGKGYPIGDLVLQHDCTDSQDVKCIHRREFENILLDMRDGKTGTTSFTRTTATGDIEKVYLAYAPVISRDFAPKNSSDFSRGVDSYNSKIFSLAVAEPEKGFLRPFQESIDVQRSINVALGVLLALIVLDAIIVTFITSRITVSITKPVTQLLELVRNINRSDMKDDLPELYGGSREVSQVYGTFERLYKVIRFANSAFFAGDLDKAYSVLSDALSVFTQLNNKKAIAVANNNLGITMLTMYRTMQSIEGGTICGMTTADIIERGTLYFNQAIALGEEALDQINEEEGWSKNYLIFMQQLSNRYFNRAMFFLTVRQDHEVPDDAETQGIKDLTVTRELDTEVADNGVEEIFQDDESARFALVLSRIRGLLILMGMSYPDDWGIEELFEEAIDELSEATTKPGHAIFRDMTAAGMMQQLDADLIEFVEVDRDGVIMAARIGIRMLVEDEFVLPDAALKAVSTLFHYLDVVEEAGIPLPNSSETRATLRDYMERFSHCLTYPEEEDAQKLSSMKQSARGDVTMEMF